MALIQPIILASSSPFRRELLDRLGLPFQSYKPDIDESPLPGESAPACVVRLAQAKAECAAAASPTALVIGSDQIAVCDGAFLNKSGTPERAMEQLRAIRGKDVEFITGVCLLNAASGRRHADVVNYTVTFRNFSEEEARRYMERERPFDCAASFKSERLGITLVERMHGNDPTALIGLPLVRLAAMLRDEGLAIP